MDGVMRSWAVPKGKLRGGWSLRRIRDGRRPTSTQQESVVSGKKIDEL
jgi:hypothetical protein